MHACVTSVLVLKYEELILLIQVQHKIKEFIYFSSRNFAAVSTKMTYIVENINCCLG